MCGLGSFYLAWSEGENMNKKLSSEMRSILERRRAEITDSYKRARATSQNASRDNGALDMIDYAVDSYAKEFLLSLSNMERKELHLIEEALARIGAGERGGYGLCQECGTRISEKRLRAVPWARHCIKCQELEEQGLLPSYHFRE